MERIRSYSFDEYLGMVKSFHGSAAPGVLIGGFMVDLAYQHLPVGGLYEAICETAECLPDAVQLLTQCTLGNKRLTVIDEKRYTLIFYEKKKVCFFWFLISCPIRIVCPAKSIRKRFHPICQSFYRYRCS